MEEIMKGLFIFLISCFLLSCTSVQLVKESSIIELPGMSKADIYQKSMQWITYKFVSGRAVMDYKNPDVGRIIAKGLVFLGSFLNQRSYVYQIATIDCINGKAKIVIDQAGCQRDYGRGMQDCDCSSGDIAGAVNEIQPSIKKFTEEYKQYMIGGQAPAWDGK